MLREARRRLADSETLSRSATSFDSGYLLRLLAFEILLKCLVSLTGGRPGKTHEFKKHFDLLPKHVRDSVVQRAIDRMSTSANYSAIDSVLSDLNSNFVGLRYPYEKYSDLTEEQYKQLGRDWVAKGMPLSEATFRYHPEELFGLVHGIEQEIEHLLANQPLHPTTQAAEPPESSGERRR
jgi:hypothetical protein